MTQNYMNLNNVWTPVLIVPPNITPTNGTISDGDTRYSVTLLKSDAKSATYIINSKAVVELPDSVKQTTLDLTAQIVNLQAQIAQMQLK